MSSAAPLNNTSSLLYSSRWLQALGGTDRVPPWLSEGGSHGGARSNKLNLSSSLYTLAAGSSTLDSVLAAFSPLRRQDLVYPYSSLHRSLEGNLAPQGVRERGAGAKLG